MPLDPNDTIAAVASPSGAAPRGLVRISGPAAQQIALAMFVPRTRRPWPRAAAYRCGHLVLDGLRVPLAAALALWSAPRTYTGQTLAEIHTTGAVPLLNLVLAQCLARGARLAEPGEFTLRAFLSGRLDLTQAEAVLGVIDAENSAQLQAALRQLAGGLAGPIQRLRDRLLDILAHIEAGLDFAEEPDVDPLGRDAQAVALAEAADDVAALLAQMQQRDRALAMPRVVLAGPPNAGKSCLFNALLGRTRALVSDQAGTTRDYLSAPFGCDGILIELVDTAGVQTAGSAIEGQAQALGAEQAAAADLLLICASADTAAAPIDVPAGRPHLHVWTKHDQHPEGAPSGALATSAVSGHGLSALRQAIAQALRSHPAEGDLPAATSARCRDSLASARSALAAAALALSTGAGDELVAIELHLALDELGKVVGAVYTDDILDRIFARFCIGK